MTHVFVVNENTFDYHLRYLFAGTGYGDYEPHLNTDENNYEAEKTLTEMIGDISKVRNGDFVIFYVTGCKKFFGTFQIASAPFFNPKNADFLGESEKLNKYLPFRVRIKPYEVYSNGISEHSALDEIADIKHPFEMCWSLIYRKLAGNRGCSFITEFEYKRMKSLIKKANTERLYSNSFCYDKVTQSIKPAQNQDEYTGITDYSLDIKNRLLHKTGAYEAHLQAYITQNFDCLLAKYLLPNRAKTLWIGNEVVCGVGEQRIDVLIVSKASGQNITIRIVELKDERPFATAIEQLKWYITWVDQYISSNFSRNPKPLIVPTIIAEKFHRNTKHKKLFTEAFIEFNKNKFQLKNSNLSDLEYISFDRTNSEIDFMKESIT